MAISFARLEFVKRVEGKNMVMKAAYSSKLVLKFDGNKIFSPVTYDWSRLEKPLFHKILLPIHVDERFKDPETLWNFVERCEKRIDAQVGYDFVMAIPDDKEISNEMKKEISEQYAMKYFVSKGYGVQIDIHLPSNGKNCHAHMLITPRHFSKDGHGFSSSKSDDLVPKVRGKEHFAYDGIDNEKNSRQFQNEYFESKGLDLRVDENNLIPQIHGGARRLRGKNSSLILAINDRRKEMSQALGMDANCLLEKLTENKSVFTADDFGSLLSSLDYKATEVAEICLQFWSLPELVRLLDKETHEEVWKFSSCEVVEEEKKIIRLAERIVKDFQHVSKKHYDKKGLLKAPFESIKSLNQEQSIAFKKIIEGPSLSCLEGLAGTGKSFLLIALRDYYESKGYIVRGFGPDNATVRVLKEKGFTELCTVHGNLFKQYFSKKNPITPGGEVWIIDESSKLGNQPLLELLKFAAKNEVKVIFSGNSAQLSSVDRGGMFKVFCDRYGYAYLGDIQRQKIHTHREIAKNLAHGDVPTTVALISKTGGFVWCSSKEEALYKIILTWAEDKVHFPFSTSIIVAHTNKEVFDLNAIAHSIRQEMGEVEKRTFACETIVGQIRVSVGDLIEIREKNKEMGVNRGDLGVLVKAEEDEFILSIEGRTVKFDPRNFTGFSLGYAITYYRSQGRTIDRCYIVYNKYMNTKLLYVGMSRHIHNVKCFVPKEEASCLMKIKGQLVIDRGGNKNTLNYTNIQDIADKDKKQERERIVKELCSSDGVLTQAKGYGFKAWGTLKTNIGSMIEAARDLGPNPEFYVVPEQKQEKGLVAEVKYGDLPTEVKNLVKSEKVLEETKTERAKEAQSLKSIAFQKLPEEKKFAYKTYFEKNEKAFALYTIVQSESSTNSRSKEASPSFALWQKACGERNMAAYDVVRSGVDRAVFSGKSLDILYDYSGRYELSIQPKESIEPQLKENMDALLYKLFPEGPQRKDARGFRFGNKGSLAVTCIGNKAGCYYDHENKEGGNLLQLIQKKEGLNRVEALSWATNFLRDYAGKPIPKTFFFQIFYKSEREKLDQLNATT